MRRGATSRTQTMVRGTVCGHDRSMRKKSVSAPLTPDSHRLDYGTTGETSTSPVRKLLQSAGAAEILVHQVAQMPHVQG